MDAYNCMDGDGPISQYNYFDTLEMKNNPILSYIIQNIVHLVVSKFTQNVILKFTHQLRLFLRVKQTKSFYGIIRKH